MLIVTRKPGEVIHVGREITITILEIERGRIRIGVDAPKSVPIMRGELLNLRDDVEQCERSTS